MIERIKRAVRGMVLRGLVSLVDDSDAMQVLQVTAMDGETLSQIEHLQPFGFKSNAGKGGNVLLLAVGGSRAHTVAIMADDPDSAPTDLAEGETVMYDANDHELRLSATGAVLTADAISLGSATATKPVVLSTPLEQALASFVPVPGDGGAALAALILLTLATHRSKAMSEEVV